MPGCNQRLLSYAGISKFLSGSLEYGNSDATVDGVLDWDIFQPRKTSLYEGSLVPHLSGRDFRSVRGESRVHFS